MAAGIVRKTAFASTGNSARTPGSPATASAKRRAQALPWAAFLSHAPLSSMPTQGAARKRIFEASCPACLQR